MPWLRDSELGVPLPEAPESGDFVESTSEFLQLDSSSEGAAAALCEVHRHPMTAQLTRDLQSAPFLFGTNSPLAPQLDPWCSSDEKVGRSPSEKDGGEGSDGGASEAATREGGSQSPGPSTPSGSGSIEPADDEMEDADAEDESSAPARVFPRRKRGESVRSTDKPVLLTSEVLSPHFDKPLKEAALALIRPRLFSNLAG